MPTTLYDSDAMFLATRKWEQRSNSPIMEWVLLLELVDACELVGPELSHALPRGPERCGCKTILHLCFWAVVCNQRYRVDVGIANDTAIPRILDCECGGFGSVCVVCGYRRPPVYSNSAEQVSRLKENKVKTGIQKKDNIIPGPKLTHRVGYKRS